MDKRPATKKCSTGRLSALWAGPSNPVRTTSLLELATARLPGIVFPIFSYVFLYSSYTFLMFPLALRVFSLCASYSFSSVSYVSLTFSVYFHVFPLLLFLQFLVYVSYIHISYDARMSFS